MINTSEALTIFVKITGDLSIYAYSFLNNRHLAEEALQDIIVNILDVQPSFQSKAHCINYFYKSVKNTAINIKNKEKRSVSADPDNFKDIKAENTQDASNSETLEWLRKAISHYPSEIADAYVRKVVYYETTKELAKELNMKPNTLTNYFKRIDVKVRYYYTVFVDVAISIISRLTFLFLRLY